MRRDLVVLALLAAISSGIGTQAQTIGASAAALTLSCSVTTSPVTVTCPAPASATAAYDDGSATAPLASPAYPSALNGLKRRPPWKVGDVDTGYGNGNPLHGQGKDWKTALPACAGMYPGQPINLVGLSDVPGGGLDGKPGCSLVGIDFTTHGGASFYCAAGSHIWFDEDDFAVEPGGATAGADLIGCQAASSVSVTRYDFNGMAARGTGSNPQGVGLVQFGGPGALTVEHGKSYNVAQHVVDAGILKGGANAQPWVIAFNTVQNTGMASAGPTPAHGDFAYFCGGTISNLHEVFNTVIEDGSQAVPLSNAAGMTMTSDSGCGSGRATLTNSEVGNNTVLMLGKGTDSGTNGDAPAGAAAFFLGGGSGGGAYSGNSIHDNYFTFAGAYFPSYQVPAGNTVSGNIDMKTGAVCDFTRPNDQQC